MRVPSFLAGSARTQILGRAVAEGRELTELFCCHECVINKYLLNECQIMKLTHRPPDSPALERPFACCLESAASANQLFCTRCAPYPDNKPLFRLWGVPAASNLTGFRLRNFRSPQPSTWVMSATSVDHWLPEDGAPSVLFTGISPGPSRKPGANAPSKHLLLGGWLSRLFWSSGLSAAVSCPVCRAPC